MSAYEPGTVAVATVNGVPNVRVMRVHGDLSSAEWASATGFPHRLHEASRITDVRPLVVLDVEPVNPDYWTAMVRHMRTEGFYSAADQIEAQTKPPKPAEPTGWGAVVEDRDGYYWTLIAPEAGVWCNYAEVRALWSDLDVARIVSEGVTR